MKSWLQVKVKTSLFTPLGQKSIVLCIIKVSKVLKMKISSELAPQKGRHPINILKRDLSQSGRLPKNTKHFLVVPLCVQRKHIKGVQDLI